MMLHHCHLCRFINHKAIKPANKSNFHSSRYWPFSFADSRTLPYVAVASVIYVSLSFMSGVILYKSISFFLEVGLEEWDSLLWLEHGWKFRCATKLLPPCRGFFRLFWRALPLLSWLRNFIQVATLWPMNVCPCMSSAVALVGCLKSSFTIIDGPTSVRLYQLTHHERFICCTLCLKGTLNLFLVIFKCLIRMIFLQWEHIWFWLDSKIEVSLGSNHCRKP